MEQNLKDKIKHLLSDRLTNADLKGFVELESTDKEIEKQWDESGYRPVSLTIKEQIWKKIKMRCKDTKSHQVLIERRWKFAVASIILIIISLGSYHFLSEDKNQQDELVKIIANQSRVYILPDSSKVWMETGSSIQYPKEFNKNRKVWLSGNSLFEVRKHQGSNFLVYINNAFIEVKGTCFLVKQKDAHRSEVTLFEGEVEFNTQSTGEKTVMHPLQKLIYDSEKSQIQIEHITNINWENGRYNFRNIPLSELIRAVNQMYRSNIVLEGKFTGQSSFSGSIRYDEPLKDVIEKICFSLNLKNEIYDNKTVIHN